MCWAPFLHFLYLLYFLSAIRYLLRTDYQGAAMKESNMIAATLTVAFYTGRGGAMSLPQIIATYNEMRNLLARQEAAKKKKKK